MIEIPLKRAARAARSQTRKQSKGHGTHTHVYGNYWIGFLLEMYIGIKITPNSQKYYESNSHVVIGSTSPEKGISITFVLHFEIK